MRTNSTLRMILCVALIAATAVAQDAKPTAAPRPASTAATKHHRLRTALIVVGVAAAATAGAIVAATHKGNSTSPHCNGPNPTTCAP